MSTAGPATWMTLPSTQPFVVAINAFQPLPYGRGSVLVQSGGAAHDFDNLSGYAGLPHAIHLQGQGVDYIGGVAAGGFHRGHAGGMFGRSRFQHGPEDLRFYVTRQQGREQPCWRLLVNVVDQLLLLG